MATQSKFIAVVVRFQDLADGIAHVKLGIDAIDSATHKAPDVFVLRGPGNIALVSNRELVGIGIGSARELLSHLASRPDPISIPIEHDGVKFLGREG